MATVQYLYVHSGANAVSLPYVVEEPKAFVVVVGHDQRATGFSYIAREICQATTRTNNKVAALCEALKPGLDSVPDVVQEDIHTKAQ